MRKILTAILASFLLVPQAKEGQKYNSQLQNSSLKAIENYLPKVSKERQAREAGKLLLGFFVNSAKILYGMPNLPEGYSPESSVNLV